MILRIKIFYILFSIFIIAESLKDSNNKKNIKEESKTYIGLKYSILEYSNNGTKDSFQPQALAWNLGYTIRSFKYYSISIDTSFISGLKSVNKSISKLNNNNSITNIEVSLDKMFSIGIKHNFYFNEKLLLYLYTGESIAKIIATSEELNSKKEYDNSISFGVGINIYIQKNIFLNVEYMTYFKNLDAIQVGLVFKL